MYDEELEEYAGDILASENFNSMKGYIQHGDMSVQEHCISVAKTSLAIKNKYNIECNTRDLIRGALLHDYFLYDWHIHDKVNPHRLHGFFHPGKALRNAKKEYYISTIQEDIIIKHMWPLTVVPPLCREAWIVTMADKYCSLMETLRIRRGNRGMK